MMKLKKLITLLTTAILTSTFFTGCSNNNSGINGTINVYNCADYIDESLISKFEDETGIKVIYDMILMKLCIKKFKLVLVFMT